MSRITQAKREMDTLLNVQSELSKFNDQKITPQLRKELSTYVNTLIMKFGMIREDKDKVIQLWTSKFYKDNGMSPDIEIYGEAGTIYVCNDSLWRTIEGLNEIVRGD